MSAPDLCTIFTRAANWLEAHDWCQHEWETATARCAATAISEECNGDIGRAWPKFRAVIGADSITGWNDAPHRTKVEVIAKLREAAQAVSR